MRCHLLSRVVTLSSYQVFSVDVDSIYEFRRGQLELTELTVESACQGSDVIILGVPSKVSHHACSLPYWMTPPCALPLGLPAADRLHPRRRGRGECRLVQERRRSSASRGQA